RVPAKSNGHGPGTGRDEIELAVVRTELGPLGKSVPGARAFGVVRVDLALARLDGLPAFAVADDDLVENRLARMRRRLARLNREGVVRRDHPKLTLPRLARAARHRPERREYPECTH